MTTEPPNTDAAAKQPTRRDEQRMKELERFERHLTESNLLYGSALDGMQPGLKAASDALAAADMDGKMAAADEEVFRTAQDLMNREVEEAESLEREMQDDDAEEEALLNEDEAGPQ